MTAWLQVTDFYELWSINGRGNNYETAKSIQFGIHRVSEAFGSEKHPHNAF